MEIQGKYIVVKVVKGGGGLISPAFSKSYAIQHYLQWLDNLRESKTIGFVKIFDDEGHEYCLKIDNETLVQIY